MFTQQYLRKDLWLIQYCIKNITSLKKYFKQHAILKGDKGHHSTLHTKKKINSGIWNLDLGKKRLQHPRTKSKSDSRKNIIRILNTHSAVRTVKFKTSQPTSGGELI